MQALWMVLASLFFSIMSVCVKYAAEHFSTFELVFYRGAIGVVLMVIACQRKGISLQTNVPKMHSWRAFTGVVSLAAWFYAIAYLPLATAMTLNYMSGIWVAAFLVGATLWQGKRQDVIRQLPVMITVVISFLGVVMILRPTFEQDQVIAGLVGLASGMIAAMAYIQVAELGREGEPVEREKACGARADSRYARRCCAAQEARRARRLVHVSRAGWTRGRTAARGDRM